MIIPERLLGFTRSGKPICAYMTKDLTYLLDKTKDFTSRDRFDAYCLFQFLALQAKRQCGEYSEELDGMIFIGACHMSRISVEFFEQEKKSLGLVTSIDIRNYGESLVHHLFRN